MLTDVQIGFLCMAVSFVGLFIEYIWREKAGRPTRIMLAFYQAMMIPMMVGVYCFTAQWGWHTALRVPVGVVGGMVLWMVAYVICGILYAILFGGSRG